MRSEAQILRNCFHDFYRLGLTTSSGGNVSCRTSNGLICISASQIDKGFLKSEDFCKLTLSSEVIGLKKPSMEYPFHLAIYNEFPETSTILHFHPPVFVALSLLSPDDPKLSEGLNKFKVGYARYKIPGSNELGEEICNAIKKGFEFVLMQNHGMLAVGKNLDELCKKIISLNNSLIEFFNLEKLDKVFTSKSIFKDQLEVTSQFYEKRAKCFLSLESEVNFKFDEPQNMFYTCVQLNSLKQLGADQFKSSIIPESFLLLRNTKYQNHPIGAEGVKKYLQNHESDIFLFPEGWAMVKGASLYNLYDKLEVLDFTAKVWLYVMEMGSCQLLTLTQIRALELRFLS